MSCSGCSTLHSMNPPNYKKQKKQKKLLKKLRKKLFKRTKPATLHRKRKIWLTFQSYMIKTLCNIRSQTAFQSLLFYYIKIKVFFLTYNRILTLVAGSCLHRMSSWLIWTGYFFFKIIFRSIFINVPRKYIIKTYERCNWRRTGPFIVNKFRSDIWCFCCLFWIFKCQLGNFSSVTQSKGQKHVKK